MIAGEVIAKGKHIYFRYEGDSPSGKTKYFAVMATDGEMMLGRVSWYSKWRKYCFWPFADTLYEQDCLRDIADFIQRQTHEQRFRGNGEYETIGTEIQK